MNGLAKGAATEWFAVLERDLRGFVSRRVRDPVEADDVLQEALLRIVRGMERVRDEERLGAWVHAVARSTVIDHFRRVRREYPEADGDRRIDPSAEGEGARDAWPSLVLAGWLPDAIEALPEPYRSTLRGAELQGRSHAELAQAEGVSVSAIKSRVARGRAKLRDAVERCCEVELDARRRVVGLRSRDCGCEL